MNRSYKVGVSFFAVGIIAFLASGCKKGDDGLGEFDSNACYEAPATGAAAKPMSFLSKTEKRGKLSAVKNLDVLVDHSCLLNLAQLNPNNRLLDLIQFPEGDLEALSRRSKVGRYKVDIPFENDYALIFEHKCVQNVYEHKKISLSVVGGMSPMAVQEQKHLAAINYASGWSAIESSIGALTSEQEVVIAIVDTGMELTHEDLSDHLWVNSGEIAGNSTDDDGNGYIDDVNGFDFPRNDGDPSPISALANHGTMVAGIAAANGTNEVGVQGIMKTKVKIMVLNVFVTAYGTDSTYIDSAIRYAADNGADVINLSLGGDTDSGLDEAISYAIGKGAFVVAAAGNEGGKALERSPIYPAAHAPGLAGFMSVGATYSDYTGLSYRPYSVTSYSNRGHQYVEIAAPGSETYGVGLLSSTVGNSYEKAEGTSVASPVVAGAAAAIIGYNRSKSIALSPAQVEEKVKAMAATKAALSNDVQNCRYLDFSKFPLSP